MSQPPSKIHLSTRRLITRTILPNEKPQYDTINELPSAIAPLCTLPQTLNTPGSHLLFIISRRINHSTPQFSVSDGTVFGILHILAPLDGNTEISFKAHKEAIDNGYLEEVLPKVVDYVFDALPVRSMCIKIAEDNHVTKRVMHSLGVRGSDVLGKDTGSRSILYNFEKFAWKCRGRNGS